MLHQNSRVFPPGRHTLEFCTTRCSTREYARALRNRGDILWCAVLSSGFGHGGTAARASIPVRVVTLHGARRVRSGPVLVWEPPGYSLFESELSLSHDYRCGEAEPSQTRHEETGARRGGEGWAHRERERRLAGEQ